MNHTAGRSAVLICLLLASGCSEPPKNGSVEVRPTGTATPELLADLVIQACLESCGNPLADADVWLANPSGDPPGRYMGSTDARGEYRLRLPVGSQFHPVVGGPETTFEGNTSYTAAAHESSRLPFVVYPSEQKISSEGIVAEDVRLPGSREILPVALSLSADDDVRAAKQDRLAYIVVEVAWRPKVGMNAVLRPCVGSSSEPAQFVGHEEVPDPEGRQRYRLSLETESVRQLQVGLSMENPIQFCIAVEGSAGAPMDIPYQYDIDVRLNGLAPFTVFTEVHA